MLRLRVANQRRKRDQNWLYEDALAPRHKASSTPVSSSPARPVMQNYSAAAISVPCLSKKLGGVALAEFALGGTGVSPVLIALEKLRIATTRSNSSFEQSQCHSLLQPPIEPEPEASVDLVVQRTTASAALKALTPAKIKSSRPSVLCSEPSLQPLSPNQPPPTPAEKKFPKFLPFPQEFGPVFRQNCNLLMGDPTRPTLRLRGVGWTTIPRVCPLSLRPIRLIRRLILAPRPKY
jgi:hypothetical protein